MNGGSYSTYSYTSGNPLSTFDPTGLAPPGRTAPGISIPLPVPPIVIPGTPENINWAQQAAEQIEDAAKAVTGAIAKACGHGDDDPCDKVLDRGLLRQAGILGQEHAVKADALGTNKSLSMFDLCGCKDGRVVVKAHGCKGPIVAETGFRWK